MKIAACSGHVEGRNSAKYIERQQPIDSKTSARWTDDKLLMSGVAVK